MSKKFVREFYVFLSLVLITAALIATFLKSLLVSSNLIQVVLEYTANTVFFSSNNQALVGVILRILVFISSISVCGILYTSLSLILNRTVFEIMSADRSYKKHYLPEIIARGLSFEIYRVFYILKPVFYTIGVCIALFFSAGLLFNLFLFFTSISVEIMTFLTTSAMFFLGFAFLVSFLWSFCRIFSTFHCLEIVSTEPELDNKTVLKRAFVLFKNESFVVIGMWILYLSFLAAQSYKIIIMPEFLRIIPVDDFMFLVLLNVFSVISLRFLKMISYLRGLALRYNNIIYDVKDLKDIMKNFL